MKENEITFDIRRDVAEAVMNGGIAIINEYGRSLDVDKFNPEMLSKTIIEEAQANEGYKWFAQLLNTGNPKNDVVRFLLVKPDMSDETECFDAQLKHLIEFHELGIFGGKTNNAKACILVKSEVLKSVNNCEAWELIRKYERNGLI